MTPYQPRPVLFHGVDAREGWRIKRYAIHLPGQTFEPDRFASVLPTALAALPRPAVGPGRHGAAVLIAHQGAGVDYLILGWWDRQNELPLRIWVRDSHAWRPAEGAESVCVWDLGVLWSERQAWVRHGMAPGGPDLEAWATDAAPGQV